ncbi:hypothetical protein ABVK25_012100 [Lepraria finkii]|uniref:Major facilitator superfamily (MFS) profile domain-containing protein n=1 Tax=Lepraria finkii TaxID=1340010 RepID=A0ABR4AKV2_9LECA
MIDAESAPAPSTIPIPYLKGWRLLTVIASIILGTFVMVLDTNIIGVAVPKILSDFHALEAVAWYGSAYPLTTTGFQQAFGNLYKIFSIENTPRIYIVIFGGGSVLSASVLSASVLSASVLSASAVNSSIFIFGRAVAGFGAAGLLQGALSTIRYAVEFEKRILYMSIVISVIVISVCIDPVLGGSLTAYTTWRWCFRMSVYYLYDFLRLNY